MIRGYYSLILLIFTICGCAAEGGGVGYSNRSSMQSSPYGAGTSVPALDPSRKVNEQDCTKSIELTNGNLRCK